MIVPLHCEDIFVIPPASRPGLFLYRSMVGIDIREGPRWLLVPGLPVLVYFRDLVFNRGTTARLVLRITQIKFAATVLNCTSRAWR